MIMDNSSMREEDRQIVAMDAASEIHIFRVHEESFVEKSRLLHRLRTKQHEAATEIGNIHQTVIARSMHLIGLIASLHPFGG